VDFWWRPVSQSSTVPDFCSQLFPRCLTTSGFFRQSTLDSHDTETSWLSPCLLELQKEAALAVKDSVGSEEAARNAQLILLHVDGKFSQHDLWKRLLSPTEWFWHHCQKSFNSMCEGLCSLLDIWNKTRMICIVLSVPLNTCFYCGPTLIAQFPQCGLWCLPLCRLGNV
jgi:hypothetical protein